MIRSFHSGAIVQPQYRPRVAVLAMPSSAGKSGRLPISSCWRAARRCQPRIISWITTVITTTSTAAKINDPESVAGVHAGLLPSLAVTLPRSRVAVTVAGKVIDS